jgi:transcriptional regulator with XRE-family HTH domain
VQQFSSALDEYMSMRSFGTLSMAKSIGTSTNTIESWLNGRALPRGKLLDNLQRKLGVTFELYEARSKIRKPTKRTSTSKSVSTAEIDDLLINVITKLSLESKKRVLQVAIEEVTK